MGIYEKKLFGPHVYFISSIFKSEFEVLFLHILAEIIVELMSDSSKTHIYQLIILSFKPWLPKMEESLPKLEKLSNSFVQNTVTQSNYYNK